MSISRRFLSSDSILLALLNRRSGSADIAGILNRSAAKRDSCGNRLRCTGSNHQASALDTCKIGSLVYLPYSSPEDVKFGFASMHKGHWWEELQRLTLETLSRLRCPYSFARTQTLLLSLLVSSPSPNFIQNKPISTADRAL